MGQSSGLMRGFGFWTASAVVVGDMIGSGIFSTTGFIAADIPDPLWILMLWFIGGVIALMGAFSVAELGAMLPFAGGDYVYCYHGYGRFPAFMSGWISFLVGFSAPIAAAAIAVVEYAGFYLPWLSPMTATPISLGPISLYISWGHFAAITLIFIFAYVHFSGVKTSKIIQNSISALKVLLIFGIIIAAFASARGSWSHFVQTGADQSFSFQLSKSGVALIFITFAYTGWNAASYIAGEIKNPGWVIPRALMLGTGFVTVLYVLLNIIYFYALPADQMAGVVRIGAEATKTLFGEGIANFTTAMFIIIMLGCLSSMIFIGPRVYYAMAKDNLFFKRFQSIHPRYQTPHTAIWLQATWASILVLSGRFDQILIYAGFILSIFMSLTVAAVFVLRWKQPNNERPYKTWGYPITPFIFILSCLWIVVYSISDRPVESLLGLITIAAGIPFYLYFAKKYSTANHS